LKHLKKLFGGLDFFCINDTTDDAQDSDPRLVQIREILSALLPDASRCEIGNSEAGHMQEVHANV
jgi:hypothetical protein